MPLRFFKLDKSHWTQNIVSSIKFGVTCGLIQSLIPYILRTIFVNTPPVNERAYIIARLSDGIVTTILFGILYYIVLILFDLHFDCHNDEEGKL